MNAENAPVSTDEVEAGARARDIYDVILENLWDAATASAASADPQEARRVGLNHAYWQLFAVVPKPPPVEMEPEADWDTIGGYW